MTRILLANVYLRNCSGTEVVTVDTAIALKKRGATVAVYTSEIGPISQPLRDAGIPVVAKIGELPWKPSVVHAHHVFQSLEIAATFPDVPQVFVCHDPSGWHSAPPRLSLIRAWGAVDKLCAKRIRSESLSPDCEIAWLANAVNLEKFARRGPLPDKPQRALAFTKGNRHLPAIRDACKSWFLPLDEYGVGVNRVVSDVPTLLWDYDIVFATARSALEALAVGCAVIVADHRGFAGMVHPQNVELWRESNFGAELLTEATTAPLLIDAIREYKPVAAAEVSDWIRQQVDIQKYVDALEALHQAAIQSGRDQPIPADQTLAEMPAAYRRALNSPQFGLPGSSTFEAVCERLVSMEWERDNLARELEKSDKAIERAVQNEREMQRRVANLSVTIKKLKQELGKIKRGGTKAPTTTTTRGMLTAFIGRLVK